VKPEMTLEEATIGASRYYKLVKSYVRRTGIDMKTDYAIAAYFAGHSTVVDQVKKHGGLTDEVIAGQISTKEYVRRYHKAIKELNGTYVPDIELIGGLQEVLSSLGYYKGKIDGIHGKATEEAIKAY
ncbi:peptidoglycan-binding domain-containing protein, partial [Pollutimonas sp. H1-120]|uniref:peptidoglycan-binding domain-containing protein n=1 Tax=Pollutimonas sp. H1-120 TaxID=3148824 RepID=UPI003B517AAF